MVRLSKNQPTPIIFLILILRVPGSGSYFYNLILTTQFTITILLFPRIKDDLREDPIWGSKHNL